MTDPIDARELLTGLTGQLTTRSGATTSLRPAMVQLRRPMVR